MHNDQQQGRRNTFKTGGGGGGANIAGLLSFRGRFACFARENIFEAN